MDDTWIDARDLIPILEQLLGEKLYSYEQKKIVQRVNLGKLDDGELFPIRKAIQLFYREWVGSLKNVFGYVSYKNLQKYIENIDLPPMQ